MKKPWIIAISGEKNTGKTTVIEGMIREFSEFSLRVATVKHDGHCFAPDRPGTDSYRHLRAGAVGAAVFDKEKYQVVSYMPVDEKMFMAMFPQADVILLEGFKDSNWPKVEILREGYSSHPIRNRATVLATVCDWESLPASSPIFGFDNIKGLVQFLVESSLNGL